MARLLQLVASMKGVVFNLLEAFIIEGWGEEAYEEILDLCPLHTKEPFVGPGTYPDADLFTIATQAAEKVGVPLSVALRSFGVFCFPSLIAKVPQFAESHETTASFLHTLDGIIHVEVRKLMPKAKTPTFIIEPSASGGFEIRYQSDRKLCKFMEGLLEGAAAHFGEVATYEEKECMHDGASHCRYDVRFDAEVKEAV